MYEDNSKRRFTREGKLIKNSVTTNINNEGIQRIFGDYFFASKQPNMIREMLLKNYYTTYLRQ